MSETDAVLKAENDRLKAVIEDKDNEIHDREMDIANYDLWLVNANTENEKRRAFNAAFEKWLKDKMLTYSGYIVLFPPLDARCEVTIEISNKWHELKFEHLDNSKGE